jgi:hypothetical protein
MERLKLIAPAGKVCPKEGGGGMIDDVTAVPVPNTAYYRRLIKEKSLLMVAPPAPISSVEVSKKEKRGEK